MLDKTIIRSLVTWIVPWIYRISGNYSVEQADLRSINNDPKKKKLQQESKDAGSAGRYLLIVLGLLGSMYGYSGWRIITPLHLATSFKLAAWSSVIVLLILPMLAICPCTYRAGSRFHDILSWSAYLSLAFITLTFFLLFFRDLTWLTLIGLDKFLFMVGICGTAEATPLVTADATDRQFLPNILNFGTISLAAILTGYGLHVARSPARVIEVSIPIDGLPEALDGFRIVQISDIHIGLTIKRGFVQRIVDQVNGLAPDLIAFTGDMVDGELSHLRQHVAPLAQLNALHGSFFVTGNHEYYNNDPDAWAEEIGELGFEVLLNQHRVVEHGQGRILVAGVTDYGAGEILRHHASDARKALGNAPSCHVRVLLAHQPRSIFAAARVGCDLQLSGHTHGGQLVPFPLQQPFIAGLHRFEDTWIYINRGTGYWGLPLRLGAPSEISLLTLRKKGFRK